MSAMQRRLGHSSEREIANNGRELIGWAVRRRTSHSLQTQR